MAITSTGIGSGLDVETIVSQLVAADRSPTETRLTRAEAVTNYKLSALGAVKSAMSALRDAANKLFGDTVDLRAFKATSSKTDLLSVSATSKAVAGDYSVTVENKARAHKLVSDPYANPDALVGEGEMTFAVGTEVFSVTTDADDTLADLRDKINKAADNSGLSASLLTEDGGTRLVLTAKETGVANAIIPSGSGPAFSELQAAEDAVVTVEGYTYTSPSNTITDAIGGVTLTLTGEEPGTEINLSVTADNSKAQSAILGFVSAYNSLVSTFVEHTKYNAEEQTAGALNGDGATRSAQQQMRQIMTSTLAGFGDHNSLSSLGIEMLATGGLKVDSAKLGEALSEDFAGVVALFDDAEQGLAVRMDAALDPYLDDSSGGEAIMDARIDSLNRSLERYDKDWERLDARMERQEALYRAQFNSLDAIVSQYTSIASFLTQNFSSNSSG